MYSNELVCEILTYINNNINKEITIDELSNTFHFNKTYIMKRFKREVNISIHEYINITRIYNTLPYFRNDMYILNIAFRNGFNSLEYFSETFKKYIGVSPIIYKKYITSRNIKSKEEIIILDNLQKLSEIKSRINVFLSNRKPKESYVKVLGLW